MVANDWLKHPLSKRVFDVIEEIYAVFKEVEDEKHKADLNHAAVLLTKVEGALFKEGK